MTHFYRRVLILTVPFLAVLSYCMFQANGFFDHIPDWAFWFMIGYFPLLLLTSPLWAREKDELRQHRQHHHRHRRKEHQA